MGLVNSIDRVHFGFLPRREESFETYQQRCEQIILNTKNLKAYFTKNPKEILLTGELFNQAIAYFEQKAKLLPYWAPIVYSTQGLGWLHLGALVETVESHANQTAGFIQLHARWKTREVWWGYSKQAVIAHELVHLIRHPLEDEKYEEFIACQFEKKAFRRIGGAFLSSPSSAMTIMLCLLMITASLGFITLGSQWLFSISEKLMLIAWICLWGSLGTLFYLFIQFAYLTYRWQQFQHKGKQLFQNLRDFSLFSMLLYSQDLDNLSQINPKAWSNYLKTIPKGPYQAILEHLLEQNLVKK